MAEVQPLVPITDPPPPPTQAPLITVQPPVLNAPPVVIAQPVIQAQLPATPPLPASTPPTVRKLKRFRSDSAPTPMPTTPPLALSISNTPPTALPIPTTPPPPSTPPFTLDSIAESPIALNEGDMKLEESPGAPARRILKIAKASKLSVSDEPQFKTLPTAPLVPPTPPIPTITEAGSMRADGTMRKTIKIRAARIPKLINQSPEKVKAVGVVKGRGTKTGRIRPNTNFLTRLVNSTERHNANLATEEQELEYETVESGDSSEEMFDEDGEFDEDEDGDTDDGEEIAEATKVNISTFMDTTANELKKERRSLMRQITKMRQKEGITLIKGIAKLYRLHVNILEDTEVKTKKTKPEPQVSLVKTVGRIGYNCD